VTIFGIDASSFQGNVNWAVTDESTEFGAEKVTEGTKYANPYWPAAKPALLARAKASGFIPLAYFFMDATGTGTEQADWFAANAGDLTGFGIAIDLERAADGSPTTAQAREAVARVREHYPHHPVGGYAPHWYTGSADLTFFDWTWASEYVAGSGTPQALYASVPSAWWAPYGGMTPLLLQFTSQAQVPGVAGPVDCSAFQSTAAALAGHVLVKAAPPPPPATSSRSDDVLINVKAGDLPVHCPVWAGSSAVHAPAAFTHAALSLAGGDGAVIKLTKWHDGKGAVSAHPMRRGQVAVVNVADCQAITVERADKVASAGASARLVNW
jgi:GH25 family lysozyme M1 (1,4-beta-N-acetylmuramidase)